MAAMRVLFEADDASRIALPRALRERYGGDLALGRDVVYANFVSSIDGVVALGDGRESGSTISGKNEDDRFLMGLLRACADVVLIGASTLRAEPTHVVWTPDFIYPGMKAEFAELRRSLGLSASPRLAVVTSSDRINSGHEALRDAILIAPAALPAQEKGRVPPAQIIQRLHDHHYRRILCEGGPSLFGQLVGADLVDELFLTIAPVLAGRDQRAPRKGLVESAALPPSAFPHASLRSLRASGSYLFLQYRLRSREPVEGGERPLSRG